MLLISLAPIPEKKKANGNLNTSNVINKHIGIEQDTIMKANLNTSNVINKPIVYLI